MNIIPTATATARATFSFPASSPPASSPRVKKAYFGEEWEDNRKFVARTPTAKKSSKWYLEGSVVHKPSGAVYGHYAKQSNSDIRKVATVLFCLQALDRIVVSIPHRLYCLVRGDFIDAGKVIGTRKWELTCLATKKWHNKESFIRKEICIQLAKNIIKIVTLPLAVIAQQFAAVIMLLSPLVGRRFFGLIENGWSRDYIPLSRSGKSLYISDYLAPCAQPKHICDQHNLYQLNRDPQKNLTIRSAILALTEECRIYKAFYQSEEHGKNSASIIFTKLEACFKIYAQFVKKVSCADCWEGKDSTDQQLFLSEKLVGIHENLIKIRNTYIAILHLNEIEKETKLKELDLLKSSLSNMVFQASTAFSNIGYFNGHRELQSGSYYSVFDRRTGKMEHLRTLDDIEPCLTDHEAQLSLKQDVLTKLEAELKELERKAAEDPFLKNSSEKCRDERDSQIESINKLRKKIEAWQKIGVELVSEYQAMGFDALGLAPMPSATEPCQLMPLRARLKPLFEVQLQA